MGKSIKERLQDITQQFVKTTNIPETQINNMKKAAEAARVAAQKAKSEKA